MRAPPRKASQVQPLDAGYLAKGGRNTVSHIKVRPEPPKPLLPSQPASGTADQATGQAAGSSQQER